MPMPMPGDGCWSLEKRNWLTNELELNPYDLRLYLQRAACHEKLGLPDLAASDSYRALLLTDEVLDEAGDYHEQTVEAIGNDERDKGKNFNGHPQSSNHTEEIRVNKVLNRDEEPWYIAIAKEYAIQSYCILARALLDTGDLKGAYDFIQRGLTTFPKCNDLQMLQKRILEKGKQKQLPKQIPWNEMELNPGEDLPENGFARREIYPWNNHEPDRFSEEHLAYINREIANSAPKCEVRMTELPLLDGDLSSKVLTPMVKHLGIFATADIGPNESVLLEPSVLTSSNRLYESYCDACSSILPSSPLGSPLPACPSCEDVYFCSQACHDRAQALYHPAVCGIEDFDIVAKDPSPFAATNALYTLLIARTMAMANTQDIHPLDLPQIKYLWGEYSDPGSPKDRMLPFSFSNNIAQPLHLLARLGMDPFASQALARFDTWVINTLLAKFRGTANAKMDERSGMPEVAGVHWLWSLANHSCAPNVRWEWEVGKMGFVARNEAIEWGVNSEGRRIGGIRAGDEVLNHYCDVELPVEERRRWMLGVLGGMCMCERCVWEMEPQKNKVAIGSYCSESPARNI